jgi:hypothetical protein
MKKSNLKYGFLLIAITNFILMLLMFLLVALVSILLK